METSSTQHQLNVLEELINSSNYNLGEKFFAHTVKKLNSALKADYTFIGELSENRQSVNTVSLYGKGQYLENFTYELSYTPCENVIGNTVCCYQKNITNLYPKDQLLIDMKIEGYVGVPTFNSRKEPTGIVVSLFEKPIPDTKLVSNMLMLFAPRIGSEMEHNMLTEALEHHRSTLEKEVQNRTAALEKSLVDLKKTQARLLQTDKLASLGILTAGIAHEINNPLNYIQGGAYGLASILQNEGPVDQEEVTLLLDGITTGVERISSIVSGLNQFSRNTPAMDEACDINVIIQNCLSILSGKLRHKIQVSTHFDHDLPKIQGNVGKLYQVFTNLFTNATDAIEDRGHISISTEQINLSIKVIIEDSGTGIPKEHLNLILDPFFTTKAPGKGTGLGLSIVHSIVSEHNGKLYFESEPKNGTKVTLTFPTNSSSHGFA